MGAAELGSGWEGVNELFCCFGAGEMEILFASTAMYPFASDEVVEAAGGVSAGAGHGFGGRWWQRAPPGRGLRLVRVVGVGLSLYSHVR
jgi:hypothetical protein